jgi:diaminohydroxyphosphoribosylaminopyrimidine deaminase/5-amino-6-(5-phosphoribosylamino)uracil reductase
MDRDRDLMKLAARLALRGHGGAEPNPLVGAVIVSPRGEIVGWGYHRQCGQAHAEVNAIRRAAEHARGATLYCTLEPCDHTGRTPPCTTAIIDAGIARVVVARRDPNPTAACGLARLQRAGITTDIIDCQTAAAASDPFIHRLRTGLPWVIVKWAQTIDGKIATRGGESKWISGERSRRMVHRERGRVDAILTGIGTVQCDDPMLTARSGRPRRIARRIVVDPNLEISLSAKLVTTTSIAPTTIFCTDSALADRADRARQVRGAGVDIIPMQPTAGTTNHLPLAPLLRELAARHDVTNVLVEAGTGVMSGLFQQKLVNEAWVFTAPIILGDEHGRHAVAGVHARQLVEGTRLQLISNHRRGDDVVARYRACPPGRAGG